MPVTVTIQRKSTTPKGIEAINEPTENTAPTYNAAQDAFEWREIGGAGGGGNMSRGTYDANNNGVVDNAEKLEGLTLSEIRALPPATHGNECHSENYITTCDKHTKADHDALGIDAASVDGQDLTHIRDHNPKLHGNERHSEAFLTTCNKHTKADHDALGIDAASVGSHSPGTSAGNLAFYNSNGRVADSEHLSGKALSEVQDHDPKMHTLAFHDVKKLDTLDELTPDAGVTIDGCVIKDGKAADSLLLDGKSKGLDDGDICELPSASEGQFLKRGASSWESAFYTGATFERESDGTLSGAPKVIKIKIGIETFYFKVYPTKT